MSFPSFRSSLLRGSFHSLLGGPLLALLLGLLLSLVLGVFQPTSASAETPAEVVAEVGDDGVYISPTIDAPDGTPLDAASFRPTVEEAQRLGIRLLVIAPADPQPDAESFALRVRQAADVEAVVLFAADGNVYGSVVDDYDTGYIRALAGARSAPTADLAVQTFLDQLVTEPDRPLPSVIATIVRSVIYLVIILGLAVLAEQFFRRRPRQRAAV
ncbi:MAG: hypothetical protein ACI8TP_004152 [Acidimicrobiales bacterium]|jgi:hypothetical protein